MAPTQPSPAFARTFRLDAFLLRFANSCAILIGLVFLISGTVHAQGGVPLVTVATDQSALNLSTQFGVPSGTGINQAGDFAFVGNGETALFFRAAGATAATRLLQIDDEAPGFPGSQIQTILPELSINSSKSVLFEVRFIGGDHVFRSALLVYDGTNYHTVVASGDAAPGSGSGVYGVNLAPGNINDSGDVDFSAVPTGTGSTTYYIFPSGAQAAVRIVGLNDTPPAACTWCVVPGSVSPGGFFVGVPAGAVILGGAVVPNLNSHGQMLLSLWGGLFIGSKDGGFSLVPMATSGPCSPQPLTTGTISLASPGINGFLNDNGVVAYTNPSSSGSAAICIAPAGGGSPSPAISATDQAPASIGGKITSPAVLGLDDSGDIIFQSPISGSSITPYALLRYHQSNPPTTDVVAYNCQTAPGTNGSFFSPFVSPVTCGPAIVISPFPSPFIGVSMANDGRVSFAGSLSSGGNAIYRQTGAAAPEFISLELNGSSVLPPGLSGGIVSSSIFSTLSQTEILNNGSVFFASYLTGGAADFALYLGTPGNLQTLMSTADPLPSGARTLLGIPPPQAAGHFVVFTAQPAAGRINLLESDLTSGAITRVVSDNDPALSTAGGPAGNTVLAPNFFLNENGQVAFESVGANPIVSEISVISFGSSTNSAWSETTSACGTIYLWSPSGGLTKVVAAGDTAPNSSTKFSCVTLNSGSPSPLNSSGQLAFISPSPFGPPIPCALCDISNPAGGVNGVYLYSQGGTISEIAAANDTLPGQPQATTFVPNLSVPVNSQGQVAFGAQLGSSLGSTFQGFFLRNAGAVQKVIENGDTIPGSSATFGFPHFIAGLTDSGNLAFTAATSAAADGLFLAPAGGGSVQTLALNGGAAPGTGAGTFAFTPPAPATPPGTFTVGFNSLKNFAAINSESDVAFGSAITGGSADSGYFRVLQSGGAAGTLQPAVLQGQAVPGGGTFSTIPVPSGIPGVLSNLGANFALGPDGTLAFVNTFIDSASRLEEGMFVSRPDGILVKVLTTGDFVPVPGGGVLAGLSISPRLAAGDAGKFAFLAGIAGGTARRAIFVTAIPPGTVSTTTTLSQIPSPAVAQQPVTFNATVTSTAGTPSGTVTFFANGISLGTGTVNAGGQASLKTSSLVAGPISILAQYDGDSKFAPGNSSALEVVVVGFGPPPAKLAVTRGQKLVIPLTVFAPAGSGMSFTLTCSGLPANATCLFDMNPVAPTPTGSMVQLTLTTMAGSKLLPVQPRHGNPALWGYGLAAMLVALLCMTALIWEQGHRWRLGYCACFGTLALALALSGCGAVGYSSSTPVTPPGTPAGPASFTVTGTSGTTTISTIVNVNVQ
jgi:hypothetical protein